MSETIREFIDRREKELQNQLAALDAQIAHRKAELKELELIKAKLREAEVACDEKEIFASGMAALPANEMTIKQLAIQALLDHFPDGGTLADIRDFIQDAYGRGILPSSLRPQMHRLKADKVLGHEPSTDTWNFRDGMRRKYAWYNHPSSRRAMKELQDTEEG
jgi:hypothetical protein